MTDLSRQIAELARSRGFELVGTTSADRLQVRDEVRAMCAADACHSYGRNWACPPAAGTLDEYRGRVASYRSVVVFETVGELGDEFDYDAMKEAERVHKNRLELLAADARSLTEDCLVLGVGACEVCSVCTYPGEACRYPERCFVSMEGAGLVVSDVCLAASMAYNHGPGRIAFVSCILV